MIFYTPGAKFYSNEYHSNKRERFPAVSVTGKDCALCCSHCERKLLDSMLDCSEPGSLLKTAELIRQRGGEGLLISGGSDQNGAVPLVPFIHAIHEIKSMGLKVICHTGVAENNVFHSLKEAGIDCVLLDIIGSSETIRRVYGIDKKPEDYENCLKTCIQIGLNVAPHIVLGLDHGKFDGEYQALEIVNIHQPKTLVIVVLKHADALPDIEECIRFMSRAREENPGIKLALGCARPAGEYSIRLEIAAIDIGFDAIAYPSVETIKYSKNTGHEVIFRDACCGLVI